MDGYSSNSGNKLLIHIDILILNPPSESGDECTHQGHPYLYIQYHQYNVYTA